MLNYQARNILAAVLAITVCMMICMHLILSATSNEAEVQEQWSQELLLVNSQDKDCYVLEFADVHTKEVTSVCSSEAALDAINAHPFALPVS